MTRFDATDPDQRQTLIIEAIEAHRTRESRFITLEAANKSDTAWVQYRAADGLVNLDCTAGERERLVEVLEDYPEFTVTEQTSPETADGINMRIQGYSDDTRTAELIDQIFQSIYEFPSDYQLWAAEI